MIQVRQNTNDSNLKKVFVICALYRIHDTGFGYRYWIQRFGSEDLERYVEFVLSICSVSFGNTADRRLG